MATNWRASPRDCGESTMSAKQIFGLDAKKQGIFQQEVLLYGDSGMFVRDDVVRQLQQLFDLCYLYGINPLPSLRKIFPAIGWEYWKLKSTTLSNATARDFRLNSLLAYGQDFVWPISQFEFVSARCRDALCGCTGFYLSCKKDGTVKFADREEFSASLWAN